MDTTLDMLFVAIGVYLVIVSLAAAYAAQPRLFTPSGGAAADFIPVHDAAALDEWWARSSEMPVALFLHDPGCPISAAAYRQLARLGGEVPLIDVRHAKQLSRAVEAQTGVRHESPQVIILWNGRAGWSASHHAITTEAVAAALRAL